MVIASEPMMSDRGETIYHLEDLVRVDEAGPELLSAVTPTAEMFLVS
jgi:Xaa-Pro aminopeptidase